MRRPIAERDNWCDTAAPGGVAFESAKVSLKAARTTGVGDQRREKAALAVSAGDE